MAQEIQAIVGVIITAFMGALGEYAKKKKKVSQKQRETAIDSLILRNEEQATRVNTLETKLKTMTVNYQKVVGFLKNFDARLKKTTSDLAESQSKLLIEIENGRNLKTLLEQIEEQRDEVVVALQETHTKHLTAEATIQGMKTVLNSLKIDVLIDTQEIKVNNASSDTIEDVTDIE